MGAGPRGTLEVKTQNTRSVWKVPGEAEAYPTQPPDHGCTEDPGGGHGADKRVTRTRLVDSNEKLSSQIE